MNFKEWQKVADDGKTCTLRHPKGHVMTIAVKSLPKIQQEAIKRLKMAEGGKVEDKSWRGSPVNEGSHRKGEEAADKRQGEYLKSEKGKSLYDKANSMNDDIRNKSDRQNYDAGTPDGTVQPSDSSTSPQNTNGDHTTNVYVSSAPPASPTPPPPAVPPVAQYSPPAPPPQVQPQPPGPITPQGGLQNQAGNTLQGIGAGQQAIQAQQGVDIAKSQAAVAPDQESIQKEQEIAAQNALAYQDLKKHTDDFKQYIDQNPINPKHYQESMGAGQKATTAIGLMLGGMSVPFGGHNFAFDALQNQINRDVQAQQKNSENQKTIWGSYHDLYGDNNVATALAKVSTNDIYAKKIQLAAHQLGTPSAMAAGMAATARLSAESDQLRQGAGAVVGNKFRNQPTGGQPQRPNQMAPQGNQKPKAGAPQASSEHILVPGSSNMLPVVAKNPLATPMMAGISEQHRRADLADKAIDQINKSFATIRGEAGDAAYARNNLEPFMEGIPFAGHSLGRAVHTFSDTKGARNYDIDRQAIKGAVRGALQGNVSDDLLNEAVDTNLPAKGDEKNPEILEKKLAALKEFIKAHTSTDLLRPFGLSKQ